MNAKLLSLIAMILLSTFALAGCGLQPPQAEARIDEVEKRIEEVEKRIEQRMEEVEKRIEEQAAEEQVENAEEERAEGAAQSESPNTKEALLRIEGDPQTEFSGSCAVGDQEGETIAGRVPQSFDYELDGQRLKCEISNQSGGDMEVILEAGNDRSVQRTNVQGATIGLTYSEEGISSTTSSSSSSEGQFSSSSSQTQEVVTD